MNDFKDLVTEVMKNKNSRLAAQENRLRRNLSEELKKKCAEENLSLRDLAKKMGTSLSQVQRVLHSGKGEGTLTLKTLLNVADALGLGLKVTLEKSSDISEK